MSMSVNIQIHVKMEDLVRIQTAVFIVYVQTDGEEVLVQLI